MKFCYISTLFNLVALASAVPHDCYTGPPSLCNSSLTSDTACRGIEVSTIDGWKRMDCDYALYNVPATGPDADKWLVIHAGGCDTYTENLGDFFALDMDLSLFGIRPCGGFEDSLCASRHNYDSCDAFHISWLFPALQPTHVPYGLGFNPPALVEIYHEPKTTMLFLHEYGSANGSYNWFPADGCNASTKPTYMCVAGLDPTYATKFQAIKSKLEAVSNSPQFPCGLEVIDAMPYSQAQDAEIPCTGILRGYNDPSRVGGDISGAPNWAWEMTAFTTRAFQLATEVDPQGDVVGAFRDAVNIALCRNFDGNICRDDEQAGSHGWA